MSRAARGLDAVAVARRQAELGNRVRGLAILLGALPDAHAEERYHLRALARWIADGLSREALEAIAAWSGLEMLLDLSAAAPHLQPPLPAPGAVLVPLVDVASDTGFLARLALEPSPGGESLPPDTAASVAEALACAEHCTIHLLARRGRLSPRASGGARWRWLEPAALRRATTAVDGASLGAAAAVALFSAWAGLPVPRLAFSGVLDRNGSLLAVEGLEVKLDAIRREAPGLEAIVPAANLVNPIRGLRTAATLEELLAMVFGPEALEERVGSLALEEEIRLGLELYEKRQSFAAAEQVLCAALDGIVRRRRTTGPDALRGEEFLALWRAGSARVHLGDPEGALVLLEQAHRLGDALFDAGELNPQLYLGVRGNLAVLLRDLRRFDDAETLLRETLRRQRALRQDKRELARTLGNLGELLGIVGRFPEAETALEEALAHLRAVYPEEVPRELCYLGDLALRRGEPERAIARYQEGLAENRSVGFGRDANHAFLRYGQVRALSALGRPEAALRLGLSVVRVLPAHRPYPRQLLLKHLGLCELALGQETQGRRTLEAAAELLFARGALARFAFTTARGELALHLLAKGECGLARREALLFAEASHDLLDRLWRTGRAETLAALAREGDPPSLAAALHAALELLPY